MGFGAGGGDFGDAAAVGVEEALVGGDVEAGDAGLEDLFAAVRVFFYELPGFGDEAWVGVVGVGLLSFDEVAPEHHFGEGKLFGIGGLDGFELATAVHHGEEIEEPENGVAETEGKKEEIFEVIQKGGVAQSGVGSLEVVEGAVGSEAGREEIEFRIFDEGFEGAGFDIEALDGEGSKGEVMTLLVAADASTLEDDGKLILMNPAWGGVEGVAFGDLAEELIGGGANGDVGAAVGFFGAAHEMGVEGMNVEVGESFGVVIPEAAFFGSFAFDGADGAKMSCLEGVIELVRGVAGGEAGEIDAQRFGLVFTPKTRARKEVASAGLGLPTVAFLGFEGFGG